MIKILAIAALKVLGYVTIGIACLGALVGFFLWINQWVDGYQLYFGTLACWLFGYTVWQCAKEDIAKYKRDKGNRP